MIYSKLGFKLFNSKIITNTTARRSILKQFSNIQKAIHEDEQIFINKDYKYVAHNYASIPVVLEKGNGAQVYDTNGRKYLDCLAAYGAVNQGHCHPKIGKTIESQLQKLNLCSRAFYNKELIDTAQYVCTLFNQDKCLFMNTGVEAGETAIKIARRWGQRVKGVKNNKARVIFAAGNFWGRTLAACASSDDPDRQLDFGPFDGLLLDIIQQNNIKSLSNQLDKQGNETVAYMIEPIQGEAGVIIPDKDYLKEVKKLLNKHNVLLISDEIQAGLGRAGQLKTSEQLYNVKPDILLLAKSLTGGFVPASVILCDDNIMNVLDPGSHGSTYGGQPLAMVAVRSALQVLIDENMCENSKVLGDLLLSRFKSELSKYDEILDIRGQGLFVAIEFHNNTKFNALNFSYELARLGCLAKPTHGQTIRVTPSLIINKSEVDFIITSFKKSFENCRNNYAKS